MYTILAMAVGPATKDIPINDPAMDLAGVRPYIAGLKAALDTTYGRKLGRDFKIEYKERVPNELPDAVKEEYLSTADLIFAMSTSALMVAMDATDITPIVFPSISDHKADGNVDGGNATGFNAMRSQTAGKCLVNFKATVPTLKTVYGLHKLGYGPVARAKADLRKVAKRLHIDFKFVRVSSEQNIKDAIAAIPARTDLTIPAVNGIQVLPDDLTLGAAVTIITAAQSQGLPTFFPVTDWVKPQQPSALGGYGVPQRTCGEQAAEHVYNILWNAQNPGPVKNAKQPDDFVWLISQKAADDLKITIPALPPEAHVI